MPDIEYSFGTGESAPNVHHSEANVDMDGDGTADAVALDFDGDGRVDDVMWDSDGDGVADTAVLDMNDDGVAEDAYHDPSGMGTWNAHGQGGSGGQQASPEPQPEPAPQPEPTPQPSPGPDVQPGPETDNGYEPYGTGAEGNDDGTEGGDQPADTDNHNSEPEMPASDAEPESGSDYEPREEDGDTTELFDTLEDAPDVDRDSISEWYDDMVN